MAGANGGIVDLKDAGFDAALEESGLMLVDFWAPWCGPCRYVAPVMEDLAEEYGDRVRFVKVNVDEAPATASRYGIRSIPTLAVFRDGEPVEGVVGVVPRQQLAGMLDRELAAETSG